MREEGIKLGAKITFPENISRNGDGTFSHFINANNILINTIYNREVIFEIINIIEDNVVLRTLYPVSGKNNGVFMCERYILSKSALMMTGAKIIKEGNIDRSEYEVSLINYKIHIDKNETINNVSLIRLANNDRYDALCINKVFVQVYKESSSCQEYDEFFFQAKNAEDALSVGMYLYFNQDACELPKMNEYASWLFIEGQYDYNQALNTNTMEAHIEWCDYLYTSNKTKFKEQEPLKVWCFDTKGAYTYGDAIVVAKNKEEAVHTFIEYATDKDILDVFSLEPTEEEELSTPLKEAKVISAWYDIC